MAWSERNLADTVHAYRRYQTQPCTIPRRKEDPLYARVAAEEPDEEERFRILFDTAHTWTDHAGGLRGGVCTRCGKTLAQVRVPIKPPIPEGSAAHLERALESGD
jgi:hypothetical protein